MTNVSVPEEGSTGLSGRIIAGIPCFNTASHIVDVITRARPFVDEVVVIDDGSTDDTARVAASVGATVVRHRRNVGYGAAIRSCFEYAANREADILITLDGDGQHFPEDIPALVAAVRERGAVVASGSRFMRSDGRVPRVKFPRCRAFGIQVITLLFNLASGCRVTDAQCGLRAYDARAIAELIPHSPGMDVSVELLVTARARRLRIVEVPVRCIYHGDSSTLHPVPHGIRVALAVVRLRVEAVWCRWTRGKRDEPPARSVGFGPDDGPRYASKDVVP